MRDQLGRNSKQLSHALVLDERPNIQHDLVSAIMGGPLRHYFRLVSVALVHSAPACQHLLNLLGRHFAVYLCFLCRLGLYWYPCSQFVQEFLFIFGRYLNYLKFGGVHARADGLHFLIKPVLCNYTFEAFKELCLDKFRVLENDGGLLEGGEHPFPEMRVRVDTVHERGPRHNNIVGDVQPFQSPGCDDAADDHVVGDHLEGPVVLAHRAQAFHCHCYVSFDFLISHFLHSLGGDAGELAVLMRRINGYNAIDVGDDHPHLAVLQPGGIGWEITHNVRIHSSHGLGVAVLADHGHPQSHFLPLDRIVQDVVVHAGPLESGARQHQNVPLSLMFLRMAGVLHE